MYQPEDVAAQLTVRKVKFSEEIATEESQSLYIGQQNYNFSFKEAASIIHMICCKQKLVKFIEQCLYFARKENCVFIRTNSEYTFF